MRRPSKKDLLNETTLLYLASLADDARRSRYLARRPGLRRASIVQELNDAARTRLRIDTHQALALAEAAVTIARSCATRPRSGAV